MRKGDAKGSHLFFEPFYRISEVIAPRFASGIAQLVLILR